MASIYTNTTSVQNAFHIEFNKPLDDRMSHESVDSFLISKSNPTACPLYKKAYVGMPVSVLNADRTAALLYVCKDATPYIFQGAGKPGAADVTAETISKYWTLMSGGEYKLVKLSQANNGMLATYKMQYKAPGKDTFSDISGADSIDIPKDYLLKEVHLCKASYNGSKYTETSKPSSSSWNTDNNDVYIHFIWFTKDGGSEKTSETYLKVSDVINVDVTEINAHIDASIAAVNKHIDNSYVSLNSSVASHINASVNAINTHIDASIAAVNRHIDSSYVSLNSSIASHIDASVNAIKTQITTSLNTLTAKIDASWVAVNNHIDSSYVSLNSSVASHIDASVNAINTRIDSSLATLNSAIDASWAAINSSFVTLDSSFIEVAQYVDSSIKTMSAHIEQYDAVHAAAFTDLDTRVLANKNAIGKLDSSVKSIDSSVKETDLVYAAALADFKKQFDASIGDLVRRVAALEAAAAASTSA